MTPPRLAVIPDFPEEGWPSMDLVAEMLLKHLAHSPLVQPTRLCAPYRCRLSWLGARGRNFDRLLNRMWHYPRWLHRHRDRFDLFHLCDHSYAQIVHELPADRTGVFCHDLDTFRCLLEPHKDPRPKWFRAMARRILTGLQKARIVFYLTEGVRRQIEQFSLLDPARLVRAPVAPAEEFTPNPTDADQWRIDTLGHHPYILHVGSCIPRKRIDVLLAAFAKANIKDLRLIQVGGEWTPDFPPLTPSPGAPGEGRGEGLPLSARILQLRNLTRPQIAQIYRGASLVLQPSEAEGFGLPVIEALACGAPVLASDIPVLREVGGEAALYCPVGNIDQWAAALRSILEGSLQPPPLQSRLAQAARFSWAEHARVIASAYAKLAGEVT